MITIMPNDFLTLLNDLPGHTQHLPAGVLLFQRADPVTQVFAVRTGRVHLLRRQEDGASFLLQRAGPGALIAEASLLSDSYHCAAETVEASSLTAWPRRAVQALVTGDKDAALAYARHLAAEVRIARLRAEITCLRRVSDRLDAWLAWHECGLPAKGEWHHLAQELNVTPEALYREIARRRRP